MVNITIITVLKVCSKEWDVDRKPVFICVFLLQAVGYSCVPVSKDEDGLVVLILNKKEPDVRTQQQQLVESLHKVLGSNQTLSVNVEGVKALPNDQYVSATSFIQTQFPHPYKADYRKAPLLPLLSRTEVIIYVVERSPNGTSKRIPASNLFGFLEQANIKAQLTQIGLVMSVTRTELSPAQLKQLLQNAPAGEYVHRGFTSRSVRFLFRI